MKSLLDKLGYKAGTASLAWRVPAEVAADLPLLLAPEPRFLIAFVHDRAELAIAIDELAQHFSPGQHIWIAYPKKSGALHSDLSRDHGWKPITDLGLLSVTQIAVNENWSALRFRFRDEIKVLRRRPEQNS